MFFKLNFTLCVFYCLFSVFLLCTVRTIFIMCNEYNIVGSSPLIFDVFAKFRAVCER